MRYIRKVMLMRQNVNIDVRKDSHRPTHSSKDTDGRKKNSLNKKKDSTL